MDQLLLLLLGSQEHLQTPIFTIKTEQKSQLVKILGLCVNLLSGNVKICPIRSKNRINRKSLKHHKLAELPKRVFEAKS